MKKNAYITFRTSEEVKSYLEQKAKEDDRTLSYIINKILTDFVNKEMASKNDK